MLARTPAVEPLTRNHVRCAPNTAAARASASATGPSRLSSSPSCASSGRSWRSSCWAAGKARLSSLGVAAPILCPGKKSGTRTAGTVAWSASSSGARLCAPQSPTMLACGGSAPGRGTGRTE
eukprot:scaffold323415_cov35-Tisochrysis_lutea.AAC.1